MWENVSKKMDYYNIFNTMKIILWADPTLLQNCCGHNSIQLGQQDEDGQVWQPIISVEWDIFKPVFVAMLDCIMPRKLVMQKNKKRKRQQRKS